MIDEETPPRTRRKPLRTPARRTGCRNTSAYAEKTWRSLQGDRPKEKHLRVRGENRGSSSLCAARVETPPRTRRKHENSIYFRLESGNTSAYAEKTAGCRSDGKKGRKHLRVRGENRRAGNRTFAPIETPPRTRRKQARMTCWMTRRRNTSAYAEKTRVSPFFSASEWKHLRVRGENSGMP